ncbi:alpha/beta hydrolase [Alkalihalobacillus sp. MEB130]|uniref:alpha/beta fold hydrolase n=1 Tax=Alkalihalobacillus sp. MEB130 TaxID=2976704 RepID=UPI0028DF1D56|nr:alpha/beta hydrolase [Alkalihalobacillus sp. MEB130]MDT8858887.1 alpha/beta hydrolase [Alkalihalobacillus sp. MEB130]
MEKEAIIFLHGMIGNQHAFKREIDRLEEQYHCIAYDYYDPADLESKEPLVLDFFIEQLYRQFRKANIEKAHLCSLSYGCIVAAAFTERYPDMVISLTFVGGYCCQAPSQFYTNVVTLLEEKSLFEYNVWVKRCARLLNPNKEHIPEDSESIFIKYTLQLDPVLFETALRVHLDFDSRTVLSKIRVPILWVMGEYDDLYKATLPDLKTLNPYIEYAEIMGAGHVAHVHQHEQFLSVFHKYLQGMSLQVIA